ncbi:MAG: EpsG family protein [Saprospiraceae bacterium]|nr:EpsG family protein [Saprospiraceae bacterium]
MLSGFYGYTFVISNEMMDAAYYRNVFLEFYQLNFSVNTFFTFLFDGTFGRGDYLQPILTYTLSRFTNDYRILFLVYGLIFGYFFSRNISFLINKTSAKLPFLGILLLLLFILLNPVWNINGVRFWTATQIFAFGSFELLYNRKKTSIFYLLLAPIMHFSYIGAILILGIFWLLPKNFIVYISILVLTIFSMEIGIAEIIKYVPQTGTYIDQRVYGYTNSQVLELVIKGKKDTSGFLKVYHEGLQYLMYLFIIIMGVNYKKIKNLGLENLLIFGIVLLSLTNILQVIPSMNRFFTIAEMIITATFFLFIVNSAEKISLFSTVLLSCILSFFLIVALRFGLDSTGLYFLILNPLIMPFFEFKTPLSYYFNLTY